jgi:hypothetical protein
LLLGVLLLAACSDDDGASEATTTTADGSDGFTPTSGTEDAGTDDGGDEGVSDGSAEPGNTDAPTVDIDPLPPVAVGEPSDFGDGLVATVTEVEAIDLEAQAPGEVAGPGVLVTLELRNDTDADVDLGGVSVNASYADGVPAALHQTGPVDPLMGTLEPGDRATGTYAFRVPTAEQGSIVLDVHHGNEVSYVIVEVGEAVR